MTTQPKPDKQAALERAFDAVQAAYDVLADLCPDEDMEAALDTLRQAIEEGGQS